MKERYDMVQNIAEIKFVVSKSEAIKLQIDKINGIVFNKINSNLYKFLFKYSAIFKPTILFITHFAW